jgi:hypothetical protein
MRPVTCDLIRVAQLRYIVYHTGGSSASRHLQRRTINNITAGRFEHPTSSQSERDHRRPPWQAFSKIKLVSGAVSRADDRPRESKNVAATYDRVQIRAALALTDPAISSYLDLETGQVIQINETDNSPATEEVRNQVMESYGDRYRYISGGNPSADSAAVATWIEAEGL